MTDSKIIEVLEKKRTLLSNEIFIKGTVGIVVSQNASKVLSLLVEVLPLQHFSLNHLKRARKIVEKNETEVFICPTTYKENIPRELSELMVSFKEVDIAKVIPESYDEFLSWGHSWPIAYRPTEKERNSNKSMAASSIDSISTTRNIELINLAQIDGQSFNSLCRVMSCHLFGAIMVNEKTKQVVMTSFDAFKYICKRDCISEKLLLNHPVYTPTMLCIEGVASLVRGERIRKNYSIDTVNEASIEYDVGLLTSDPYLCYGLILYVTHEPDIMSCMALVHSRIHSVYFKYKNPDYGGLGSHMYIHTQRSLNHHYSAYQVLI